MNAGVQELSRSELGLIRNRCPLNLSFIMHQHTCTPVFSCMYDVAMNTLHTPAHLHTNHMYDMTYYFVVDGLDING